MAKRWVGGDMAVVALAGLVTVGVSTGATQGRGDTTWTVPRTADGRADLQGLWSNNGATPLERPAIFGDRAVLTEEKLAEIRARADQLVHGEEDAGATVFGDYLFRQAVDDPSLQLFDTDTGNYNAFWIAGRTRTPSGTRSPSRTTPSGRAPGPR